MSRAEEMDQDWPAPLRRRAGLTRVRVLSIVPDVPHPCGFYRRTGWSGGSNPKSWRLRRAGVAHNTAPSTRAFRPIGKPTTHGNDTYQGWETGLRALNTTPPIVTMSQADHAARAAQTRPRVKGLDTSRSLARSAHGGSPSGRNHHGLRSRPALAMPGPMISRSDGGGLWRGGAAR